MKLRIETEKTGVQLEHVNEYDGGLTVSEVVEFLFRPALLAMGYQPESIARTIGPVDDEVFEDND